MAIALHIGKYSENKFFYFFFTFKNIMTLVPPTCIIKKLNFKDAPDI